MELNLKSFIKKLSSNENFKNLAEDIDMWKKLPHTLEGLDLLLKNNIVELEINSKNLGKNFRCVCTSNLGVLSRLSNLNTSDFLKRSTNALKAKNPTLLTYNFLTENYLGIVSNKWEIKSIITIRDDNADILNKLIKNNEFK